MNDQASQVPTGTNRSPPDEKKTSDRTRRKAASIAFILSTLCIVTLMILWKKDFLSNSIEITPTFAPTPSPTAGRDKDEIYKFLAESVHRNPEDLKNGSSDDPAVNSAHWIVNVDRREVHQNDQEQILARFALATLHFATQGWNWTDCGANFDPRMNSTDIDNDNDHDHDEMCHHSDWSANWTGYRYLSPEHHCNWMGIRCLGRNENSPQIRLSLNANNLHGSIPSELGLLPNLMEVKMSHNNLNGIIHKEIFVPSLTNLDLGFNSLSGEIPQTLKSSDEVDPMMRYLDLSFNKLTGTISTEIGNLTKLRFIRLLGNKIRGQIPNEVGTLEDLVVARLGPNQFSGKLPTEFGGLKKLTYLNVEGANLTGSIPDEYRNLEQLEYFSIGGNQITGDIDVLYDLPQMREINVSGNFLTGTLSSDIGNLKGLFSIDLSHNLFHGPIPRELVTTQPFLRILALDGNDFTGTILNELCDLNLLEARADCLPPMDNDASLPKIICECCNYCCDNANVCALMNTTT